MFKYAEVIFQAVLTERQEAGDQSKTEGVTERSFFITKTILGISVSSKIFLHFLDRACRFQPVSIVE